MSDQTELITSEQPAAPVDLLNEARGILAEWGNGKIGYETAIERIDHILNTTAETEEDYGAIENIKGIILAQLGKFSEAAQIFQTATQRLVALGDFTRASSSTLNLGETYRFQGKFQLAQEAYRKTFNMAQAVKDDFRQGLALLNESYVLLRLKQYDRAQYVAKEALAYLDRSLQGGTIPRNFTGVESSLYGVLAMVAMEHSDPEKAWQHAAKSLKSALDNAGALVEAATYRMIGTLITRFAAVPDEFIPDADHYFAKAIEIFQTANVQTELGLTLMAHADSLIKRNRSAEALPILKDAIAKFTKMNMVGDLLEARMLYAKHARTS